MCSFKRTFTGDGIAMLLCALLSTGASASSVREDVASSNLQLSNTLSLSAVQLPKLAQEVNLVRVGNQLQEYHIDTGDMVSVSVYG